MRTTGLGKGSGDGSKKTRFVANTQCSVCRVELTPDNRRQGSCKPCAKLARTKTARRWRDRHPEQAKAIDRRSGAKRVYNPISAKAFADRWRAANPDRWRAIVALNLSKRRAVERAGTLTVDQWFEQLEVFGHACAYCLRSDVKMSMDHVDPLSKGGAHAIENLVPACRWCNSRKQARGPLSMVNRLADFDK